MQTFLHTETVFRAHIGTNLQMLQKRSSDGFQPLKATLSDIPDISKAGTPAMKKPLLKDPSNIEILPSDLTSSRKSDAEQLRRSNPQEESKDDSPVAGGICKNCHFNIGNSNRCPNCGFTGDQMANLEMTKGDDDPVEENKDGTWECKKCSLINEFTTYICEACCNTDDAQYKLMSGKELGPSPNRNN